METGDESLLMSAVGFALLFPTCSTSAPTSTGLLVDVQLGGGLLKDLGSWP